MNDTYVECLVSKKPSAIMNFLKILLIMLAVVAFLGGMTLTPLLLFAALIIGFVAYYVSLKAYVEYEYLYLDREISIDRIIGQSRRKRVATYEVDRMEILAPINSYHLDEYKNRQVKILDYSTGVAQQPDTRYVLFYEGNQKVIFEPNPQFVRAVYNVAPRKVFTD